MGGKKDVCFLGVDYQIRRKFTFLCDLMIPLYRLIGDSSSELVIFHQIKQAKKCTVECCHSQDNMENCHSQDDMEKHSKTSQDEYFSSSLYFIHYRIDFHLFRHILLLGNNTKCPYSEKTSHKDSR